MSGSNRVLKRHTDSERRANKETVKFLCLSCPHKAEPPVFCAIMGDDSDCRGHGDPDRAMKYLDAWRWKHDKRRHSAPPAIAIDWNAPHIDLEAARANYVTNRCVVSETGCWEWQGALGSNGYGRIKINGKLMLPHRLVASGYGIIDAVRVTADDQYVLHECDNRSCCNPAHMKAGTLSQNMQDCAARGRGGNQKTRS